MSYSVLQVLFLTNLWWQAHDMKVRSYQQDRVELPWAPGTEIFAWGPTEGPFSGGPGPRKSYPNSPPTTRPCLSAAYLWTHL